MRAIIIDDEEDVRVTLTHMIEKYVPSIELIGEGDGVSAGKLLIEQVKPELLFLDFEMGDGTGFDLLDSITDKMKVIFVTAHSQHALKAFRYSAVDYLLKPIDPLELVEAVNKAMDSAYSGQLAINTLKSNLSGQPDNIILKDLNNIYLVKIEELMYCQSENYYTTFFLTGNRKYIISKSLKHFEEQLEDKLLRTHQSYLVNFMHVGRFNKSEGGVLVLTNGMEIPVSNRKKEAVMNYIGSLGIN